jgi:hypothetical protein
VRRVGTRFFAELGVACGRVRIEITAMDEWRERGAGALIGGRGPEWTFQPGPVTWPDGSSAGRLVRTKSYRHFDERKDTVCVAVPLIAEPVCHAKKHGTLRN